ncbi:hypothetical protein OG792_16340 [Micromonospora sp. NBC_01699]|uniref:hypothetical protein n=1 Tax=Micromonospora sp. NBC_01699 TaxID=2975984 RepID=UPI002E3043DB|nr:hypothetical protein [Micromonospora sp. NBC_01699]
MRTVHPRSAAVAVLLVAVGALTGCGSGGTSAPPYPTPTGPVVVSADCPTPVEDALPGLTFPAGPVGNVPADFVAVAALRCTVVTPEPPGPTVLRQERLDGAGLDGLLAALAALATPRATPRAPVCPVSPLVAPYVALVAADGTAIRPAVPVDGCGQPRSEVLETIAGLPWRTVREKQR